MTAVILAGGENKRTGLNKALLKLNGQSLMETIIGKLRNLFKEVIIVSSYPREYERLNLKVVKDLIPQKGPLGGIYSGLSSSKSSHSFVVACDMPFINPDLIRYMKVRIDNSDVLIPMTREGYEPLHAFYSKNCLDVIRKQLDSEASLKIVDFFDQVKVKYIEEEEVRKFDPDGLSFFNINTSGDLNKARQIAKE
ncbi:molybdenum cofactor guanylyltransferase [bacterium]|nr:molybdenum cofactor guanylyltransferase [bacterium]